MRNTKVKTKKLRYYKILEDVFFCRVHVFLDGTYEDYRKKLESLGVNRPKHEPSASDNLIYGESGSDENGNYFIYVKDQSDLGTIHHEVIHLIFRVLGSKGIPINIENEETFAYYSEYWFKKIKDLK